MRLLLPLLLLLPALLLPRVGSAQLTPLLAQQLQAEIDRAVTVYHVKGVAAALILPDDSEWTGAAGVSTTTPPDPIRPDMLFGIASITKTFTAAIILRLAERGLLSLDDAISQHLPAWALIPEIDPQITVRQLLNHTSGLYSYNSNPDVARDIWLTPGRLFTPQDILGYMQPMITPPGARYFYTNTNYVLLGIIIEHKLGIPLQDAYHRELWAPHHLTSTYLGYADSVPAFLDEAHAWTARNGVLTDVALQPRTALFSSYAASGAALSTPSDVAHWMKALFGGQVLTPASLQQMQTVSPLTAVGGYGLGCTRLNLTLTRTAWGHLGYLPSCLSIGAYEPTCGVSLALVFNDDTTPTIRWEMFTRIYNMVLLPGVCQNLLGTAAADAPITAPESEPTLWATPNPATDHVTLTYRCPPATRSLTLRVIDAAGRTVQEVLLDPQRAVHADLPLHLAPGVYSTVLYLDGVAGPRMRLAIVQ